MKTQDLPADGFVLPAAGNIEAAVQDAQNRLLELRRRLGRERGGDRPSTIAGQASSITGQPSTIAGQPSTIAGQPRGAAPTIPPHYSETLVHHLRVAAARRERLARADSREWLNQIRDSKDERRYTEYEIRDTERGRVSLNSSLVTRRSSFVRVYPDIALAMLRRKLAAPGRVWLLLRHYDHDGRGRLPVDEVTRLLTGEDAPHRVCGPRQLRNLLVAGEGVFWQRDTGRDGQNYLRLHSAARAAAHLGVPRLGGSPVAVPLSALTGAIGDVRAHLYATFHSGRQRRDFLTGETRPRGPIARSTMTTLSAAAPNSQRAYERRAGVHRRATFAVGPRLGTTDEHEAAWSRGRALFHFRDRPGRFGRPGAVYLAWQLPNEYTGPHATMPRGRMKRHNRALADLFVDGMTGNSEPPAGSSTPSRRFFGTAKAATLSRGSGEKYWRHGGVWLWQPELRDTSYEIRKTDARQFNSMSQVTKIVPDSIILKCQVNHVTSPF